MERIAKKLEISRNTVYKYLEMTFDEASNSANSLSNRKKKLDPYRDQILSWLKEHPDFSSAQIEDKDHRDGSAGSSMISSDMGEYLLYRS